MCVACTAFIYHIVQIVRIPPIETCLAYIGTVGLAIPFYKFIAHPFGVWAGAYLLSLLNWTV